MSIIRLDMTMSLDGYVTGPDDGPDEPMGVGGFRLLNWLDKRNDPGPSGDVYAELLAADLHDLAFGAQPRDPQRRLGPARQHQPRALRHVIGQHR
jgi:hypothetical protein